MRSVFERRQPLFVAVSTHDFVMQPGECDWAQVELDFSRFVRRITKGEARSASTLPAAPRFVLRVDSSADVDAAALDGVDGVELRVDALASRAPIDVLRSVAALRRAIDATHGKFSFVYRYISRESCSQFDSLPLTSLTISVDVPIIFTARSQRNGGALALDDGDDAAAEAALCALSELALRAACEFVDVECSWPGRDRSRLLALLRRRRCYHTRAIGTSVAAAASISGSAATAIITTPPIPQQQPGNQRCAHTRDIRLELCSRLCSAPD